MKSAALFCILLFLACTGIAGTNSEGEILTALTSGKPSMIDFGGESCKVCKEMKPVLDQARHDYKGRANIVFIDVWKEPALGRKYRIQLIPTQIFFNAQGQEVKRHMGYLDRQGMAQLLAQSGVK